MSHIVTIESKVRDPGAITAACARLNLPAPVQGTAQLFSGECTGLLVQFPGWHYPAVIDTQTGQVKFDNFEGNWGDPVHLDQASCKFMQSRRRKLEARKRGYTVTEQAISDGSIKLQIIEGAKP